jgi:hypothetical protein
MMVDGVVLLLLQLIVVLLTKIDDWQSGDNQLLAASR